MWGARRELAEELRRNREAFERNRDVLERSREESEDLRAFIRDINMRNERVWREVLRELQAGQKALADLRDEIKANTQAVLSVLDRLDHGDASSA
jgi:flagellar biosynthesis regulator FlaF